MRGSLFPQNFFVLIPLCGIALLILSSRTSSAFPKIPEEQGARNLEEYAKTYSNREEWQARAKKIRAGILEGSGLNPLPRRTPLESVIHSRKEMDGYSVENVYFESLPGFFVTGNLYRPLRKGSLNSFAGVLCPHGHSKEGRTAEYTQVRCAALARMGSIVFAYDMVGWNQDNRQTDHRKDKNVFAFQTWNSMRALDFLLSFREVDPRRIGVTGESGGGTQTLLTALDDRVRVAAPVVMASAHFYGGCNCEACQSTIVRNTRQQRGDRRHGAPSLLWYLLAGTGRRTHPRSSSPTPSEFTVSWALPATYRIIISLKTSTVTSSQNANLSIVFSPST